MTVNPYGASVVYDGEVPRTFTAVARETISGGQFVLLSGAAFNDCGSHISQFTTEDMEVILADADADGIQLINGYALNNATSGNLITATTRGAVIVQCGGSVLPGTLVEALTDSTVQSLSSGMVASALHADLVENKIIGRGLIPGYSGTAVGATFALVHLGGVL